MDVQAGCHSIGHDELDFVQAVQVVLAEEEADSVVLVVVALEAEVLVDQEALVDHEEKEAEREQMLDQVLDQVLDRVLELELGLVWVRVLEQVLNLELELEQVLEPVLELELVLVVVLVDEQLEDEEKMEEKMDDVVVLEEKGLIDQEGESEVELVMEERLVLGIEVSSEDVVSVVELDISSRALVMVMV